jgi:hypothetical protein
MDKFELFSLNSENSGNPENPDSDKKFPRELFSLNNN